MGIIYKITNKITSKAYVGQTTRNIYERWREHKSRANPSDGSYLHNAMAKYGHENFTIEEIDNCDDDIINEKEIEWIAIFNTYYPNGYNLTTGGEGQPKVNHLEIVTLWESGKSLREIADILKVNINTVGKHLRDCPSYSITEARRRALNGRNPQAHRRKGINQYTWDGKFVKHYSSAEEVVGAKNHEVSHL